MKQEKIDRINELARKAKADGLTVEEEAEREALRLEYKEAILGSLRSHLENTWIVDERATSGSCGTKGKNKWSIITIITTTGTALSRRVSPTHPSARPIPTGKATISARGC